MQLTLYVDFALRLRVYFVLHCIYVSKCHLEYQFFQK